jgi:uncharacterized protein involved in exopolysaccharide biosynthesis
MEHPPEQDDDQSQQPGIGVNLEVVYSFLKFARSAIARRKLLIALVMAAGLSLTFAVAKYLPRTYNCTTVMMTVSSGVLESDRGSQPLAGSEGLILSYDSLERLINDIGLKKKYVERRPPLMAFKDRIMAAVFAPMDDKTLTAVLIGTLGSKLTVTVEKETLTIEVEWSDGKTAAEIAEAAREGFVRMRHTAEMSAFQDKMAILDSHAVSLRAEIGTLAQQMKQSLAAKRAELAAEAKADGKLPSAPKQTVSVRVAHKPVTDEQLPELRERLTALKQKLSSSENDRNTRMREEQAKLDELKIRLTPSHPQVIAQEERLGMTSQVSSELALMRSEVQDLESQIRQREAMQRASGTSSTSSGAAGPALDGEPLPTEILALLDERDADPALAAQISGAVVRYGSLRDDVRGAQLALDTAQAAFSRRYQVTVPVEEPNAPTKPKKAVILGAGAALCLLLALLLPILLEVGRDVVVERWQVHQFQLPVLGELRLPPSNKGG